MSEQELKILGHDCYAAFNAAPPAASSRAWALWAEMCAPVPLKAAPWIRSRILEQDSMPRNFGKAVLCLWQDWHAAQRGSAARRDPCPDCDAALPGFFYWWRHDASGRLYSGLFRCLCNHDSYYDPMPRRSKDQARREGYSVMPEGFQGGWAAFTARMMERE